MTNTSPTHTIVEKFFKDYERGTNTFDADIVTAAYTKDFMSADPNGVYPTKNDAAFRKAVSGRKQQFEAIGFESAKILTITQSSISDDYVKARVKWEMNFKKDSKPIAASFLITYILLVKDKTAQIVFYVSHESEEKMMKELGII